MGGRHERELSQQAGVLEVTVGDGPLGVGRGDEVALDVGRKGLPPQVALSGVVKVDSSHPSLGSIGAPKESRILGDDLGEVRGTVL